MNGIDNLSPLDRTPLATIIELTKIKFPGKLTRREFLRLAALFGAITALGTGKRIYDLESTDWKMYATSQSELINRAMQYKKIFQFGCWPDFDMPDINPWVNADLLSQATLREDKIGLFYDLEWFDVENHPLRYEWLLNTLRAIKDRRATPILSIHTSSTPDKLHPFHEQNQKWMLDRVQKMFHYLDADFPYRIDQRLFFEMNLRNAFVYGPTPFFSGLRHSEGYKNTMKIIAQERYRSKYERHLAFCPSVIEDFKDYYISELFDSVGVDGYNIYPGKISEWANSDISFETWVQLLYNYFAYANQTPEQVFIKSLRDLRALTNDQLPTYIFEMGTKDGSEDWLEHALWVGASEGIDGAFPFIYDKEKQALNGIVYESNWAKNIDLVAPKYGQSVQMLNTRRA